MENKMYQDEFEQFLQDEVKQHRMYPSDHIWKNIRTEMHGYKAWPALTFIALFIITALTVSTLVSNHPHEPVMKTVFPITETEQTEPVSPIATATRPARRNYLDRIMDGQITPETVADMAVATTDELLAVNTLRYATIQPVILQRTPVTDKFIAPAKQIITSEQVIDNVLIPAGANASAEDLFTSSRINREPIITSNAAEREIIQTKEMLSHPDLDENLNIVSSRKMTVTARSKSHFGFQFYITPSTSYRKLTDEKVKEVSPTTSSVNSIPLSNGRAGVNNVVRHRPAVGIEVGFAVLYDLSARLKFKTGLQLNVRQYHIETFQSLTNDLASVSLINYRGVETVSFYSPYNNNTGYRSTELDNKVYQVSVPIGIQWDVIKGRHLGFNTEASVQPTFTLNNNTYLLSTDYKHYTDGNQFMRRWNINTSVGMNLTYKMGSTSWQIGPQIRYQHLPTYSNAYPIREHLMDYGVRLAFTKQLR